MSSQGPARLGELRRVKNTDVEYRLEAGELLVGHVMLDDRIVPVAFTSNELDRPTARAEKNKEDIGALAINPPDWDEVSDMKVEIAKIKTEQLALLKRGLWDRIMNRVPEVGDEPRNEE
jgi:hypothetical protein